MNITLRKNSKIKFRKTDKKLVANIKFNAKLAQRLVDASYYRAQGINMREYEKLEKEKIKLSTLPWETITTLLKQFKKSAEEEKSEVGRILVGLYEKNKRAATNNVSCVNTKLLSIVSKPEILMIAYRSIRGNKGALTPGAEVSTETYNNMTTEQKELYLKSLRFPDGISLYYINLMSKLLQKGIYPWGTSSRVYFDKPGQPGKKRPITIPPFTDRIVQKAIELVLQSIYEPVFEKMNRSFGFRPNVGTHDALSALTSRYTTNGMRTAVEGDVEAAYDTVNRDKLIEILRKRIQDEKFLKLIRKRLDYEYTETTPEGYKRNKPSLGIPQGGIDSPYLLNIYMHELDEFIHGPLTQFVEKLNAKQVEDDIMVRKFNKTYTLVRASKKKLIRQLGKIKTRIKNISPLERDKVLPGLRQRLFAVIKAIRLNTHQKNRISSSTSNKKTLRIFYIRYADDWILLTNGGREVGEKIKSEIAQFLWNNLQLKLSEIKTLVTDITKHPAKFLGFELRISPRGAVQKVTTKGHHTLKKFNLQKRSGILVWASPDRQRLINRLHMKGFCSKSGFPTTVPWLSCLEAHAIVDRFNATIRGLAEYHLPIVRNRSSIHRWIYILRFACLKTLAQKYKCSIKKIFKRFGHNMHNRNDQTIRIRVVQKSQGESYFKDWVLLTYSQVVKLVKYKKQSKELITSFLERESGKIGEYPLKKRPDSESNQ
jgi:retron-type reverse transcriptase